MIKYPITLVSSTSTCIFNNHCYDYLSFDHLRMMSRERNMIHQKSRYRNRMNRFSDQQTGDEFNYNHTANNLYHCMLTKSQLREILVNCASGLTMEKYEYFNPPYQIIMQVTEFVTHIKVLYKGWHFQKEVYEDTYRNCHAK